MRLYFFSQSEVPYAGKQDYQKFSPFRPGVDQNLALRASSAARNSAFQTPKKLFMSSSTNTCVCVIFINVREASQTKALWSNPSLFVRDQ